MGICDRLVQVGMDENIVDGVAVTAKERERQLLSGAKDQVLDAAVNLAREICEGGPIATRQLIQVLAGRRLLQESDIGSAAENEGYEGVIESEDRNEALRAFREKRKPVFKGR